MRGIVWIVVLIALTASLDSLLNNGFYTSVRQNVLRHPDAFREQQVTPTQRTSATKCQIVILSPSVDRWKGKPPNRHHYAQAAASRWAWREQFPPARAFVSFKRSAAKNAQYGLLSSNNPWALAKAELKAP